MKKTEFHIRKAIPNDVPRILSFIKELAAYERLSHEVRATEKILRSTLFGRRKVAEVILGFVGKKPIGFALFFHNFSTFLGKPGIYLEDLYIKPEYRGKGYGRSMLTHIVKIAMRRNCGRVEWWVLHWNKPAIKFYRKLGAVPMKDWRVYRLTANALGALARD